MWAALRELRLVGFKFRRQESIGSYVCDFVCFSKKLIVEVDGSQHADNVIADQKRTEWLESQGFRVLRFWNNQVVDDIETVIEAIANALNGVDYPLAFTRKTRKDQRRSDS